MGTIQGPDGEVLVIALLASDRRKTADDKLSGLVLSGVYIEVTWVGNLEGAGAGEGGPLGNSEGTRVGNILVIYYGAVPGITFGVTYIRKFRGDERSWQVLLVRSCEGVRYGSPAEGGKDIEDSELVYALGAEDGSEIGFSYEIFDGNKDSKVEIRSLVDSKWVEIGTDVGPSDITPYGRDVGKLEGSVKR